jgi:hypothetical protein
MELVVMEKIRLIYLLCLLLLLQEQATSYQKGAVIGSAFIKFIANNAIDKIG